MDFVEEFPYLVQRPGFGLDLSIRRILTCTSEKEKLGNTQKPRFDQQIKLENDLFIKTMKSSMSIF